jgi:hypothetical protein
MRSSGLPALLLVCVGVGVVGAHAPAEGATPSGSVTSQPGVLYDDTIGPCTESSYDWNITADGDWTLLATSRNPAGDIASTDFITSASGAAGSHDLLVCDGAGTYSMSGELTVNDGTGEPIILLTTTFVMTKAPTRSKIKVSDTTLRPGQKFNIRLRSDARDRSGWTTYDNARVRLQGKVPGGHWSYLTAVKPTDTSGALTLTYLWTGKSRVGLYRCVTVPTDRLARSFSQPVRLTQSGR